MPKSVRRVLAGVVALTALSASAPAMAGPPASLPVVKRSLGVDAAADRSCAKQRTGGRSADVASWRAPMSGYVRVRLAGAREGDWDLALFDTGTGRLLGSSESFGSTEVAQTWVAAGQRLAAQGCLREGASRRARVAFRFFDVAPPKFDGVAKLMRVNVGGAGDIARLERAGLDVTHNLRNGQVDVNVFGAKQLAALEQTGLKYEVRVANLAEDLARSNATGARYAARTKQSPLPTGRDGYRELTDYQNELKAIVERYPALARPVTIGKTYEGRNIDGVEISQNVARTDDGRPTFVLVGMHHAREWPSAEAAMEFAWMLVKGFGSDQRITSLLARERIVVIPIDNVDGFVVSRRDAAFSPTDQYVANGGDPHDVDDLHLVEAVAPGGPPGAYRRKNCHGDFPVGVPCELQHGVDPNRNYGEGWGGNGASTDPFSQTYRGSGPWSEPETDAFWKFTRARNVTGVISLHNVAALVLRPPGRRSDGLAPDEPTLKRIGDAMADATGYTSQFGWQLYDTSGTTEDWNYAAQGALGYTIEIGPQDGQFHMPYQTGVVDEWTGTNGRSGLRGALLIGAEAAADPANIATIQGDAPAGRVLRLHKDFKTSTSGVCAFSNPSVTSDICEGRGDALLVDDQLDMTTTVPAGGSYSWKVGPSTRPFVAEKRELGELTTLSEQRFEGVMPADGSEVVHEVVINDAEAAETFQAEFALEWDPANASDLDLYVDWRDPVTGEYREVAQSGRPPGSAESASLIQPRPGQYRIRIVNFLAPPATPYRLTYTRSSGNVVVTKTGQTEAYTMTCETPGGRVLETRHVTVARGQTATANFACGAPGRRVLGVRRSKGKARILTRKARMRGHFAAIRLACSKAGPCAGVLRLTRGERVLGKRAYSMRAGATRTVRVRVSRSARAATARARRGYRVVANAGSSKRTIRLLRARR